MCTLSSALGLVTFACRRVRDGRVIARMVSRSDGSLVAEVRISEGDTLQSLSRVRLVRSLTISWTVGGNRP